MVDKDKILSNIDELRIYLDELGKIMPADFDEYTHSIEKKRACERLLQISIETLIDISNIIISGLKLGIPSDEDIVIEKLRAKKIISEEMSKIFKKMKGFRNLLVHKYGEVDDEMVFESLSDIDDFERFIKEIMVFLKKNKGSKDERKL